jgi:hypothetical protein
MAIRSLLEQLCPSLARERLSPSSVKFFHSIKPLIPRSNGPGREECTLLNSNPTALVFGLSLCPRLTEEGGG